MKRLYNVEHIQNEMPYEVWTLDEPIDEFYCDGTEGLIVSDGIVKFNMYTLAVENDSGGGKEPTRKKIITKRIIMPLNRFFELINRGVHVQKMIQQQEQMKNVEMNTKTIQ